MQACARLFLGGEDAPPNYDRERQIGYRQAEVLYCLRKELLGPDPASPSSLAVAFNVRPSAMTRVLTRLEQAGYIVRQADPIDRRAQTLHITPAGEAISIVVEDMVVRRMADALAIVPTERLALLAEHIELLHEISLNLQQDREAPFRAALDPAP